MNRGKLLKIDKPSNLIKELIKHDVEITLSEIDQNAVALIDSLGVKYSIEETKVTFNNIENPFEWCPLMVNKLINAGSRIVYIKEITGLEDVYMGLLK